MGERIILNILIATLVVGLLLFVFAYVTRSNWRDNPVGRYILYFWATIAGMFVYILIYPIIKTFEYIFYVNVAVLIALNIGAWKMALLLLKMQKEKDREDEISR